jgi:hypothetical protein
MGKRKPKPVEPPVGLNAVMRGEEPKPPENRDPAGRFVTGASGNPGGRPAIAREIREAAQGRSMDAFRKVEKWMDDASPKISLAAALAILKIAGVPMTPDEEAGGTSPQMPRPYSQAPTDELLKRATLSSTLPQ